MHYASKGALMKGSILSSSSKGMPLDLRRPCFTAVLRMHDASIPFACSLLRMYEHPYRNCLAPCSVLRTGDMRQPQRSLWVGVWQVFQLWRHCPSGEQNVEIWHRDGRYFACRCCQLVSSSPFSPSYRCFVPSKTLRLYNASSSPAASHRKSDGLAGLLAVLISGVCLHCGGGRAFCGFMFFGGGLPAAAHACSTVSEKG